MGYSDYSKSRSPRYTYRVFMEKSNTVKNVDASAFTCTPEGSVFFWKNHNLVLALAAGEWTTIERCDNARAER